MKTRLRITRYQPAALAFFQRKEAADESFTATELAEASGYPLGPSLNAKLSRGEFGEFLVEEEDGRFHAVGTIGLSIDEYAKRTSSHYRRSVREVVEVPKHDHSNSYEFSENAIKGRVAETIIQELFLAHGFNVFHYGMERSVPGIAQLTRKTDGDVKRRLQTMPDFVVQDPRTNHLHFVEVKYRSNGSFSINDIKGEYPWPHAYFIVVSREHIKCLTYKQLATGKGIAPACNNLLIVRKDLDLDRKLIVQFGQLAKRFFTGV